MINSKRRKAVKGEKNDENTWAQLGSMQILIVNLIKYDMTTLAI